MPFPWDDVIAFGLSVLRLAPADLWALTPIEIGSALNARRKKAVEPPRLAELEALIAAFPDEARTE